MRFAFGIAILAALSAAKPIEELPVPENVAVSTSAGAPILNNQDSITAGPEGPIVLADVALVDKLAHFDRERIPERVVHARGATAHGTFKVTNPDMARFTRASFLQTGEETPVFVRFSTVGGERGSADSVRDPRGFAVKFFTKEGNADVVGNNTPIFFIRDPIKFPDFIHTQKRNPRSGLPDATAVWDFFSQVPESLFQMAILFSDNGLPDGFTHMDGFSSHTLSLVNEKNEITFVKWHWVSDQGLRNLTPEAAARIVAEDPNYATRQLFDTIEEGKFPSWTLKMQMLSVEEAKDFSVNIFDVTKVWPLDLAPEVEIGKMTLNRNQDNFFAENEQSAFSPANLVPGIGLSNDRMLHGRVFAYPDTQRYRLTANHMQIPINAPLTTPQNQQRDGYMAVAGNGGASPNYEPNTLQSGGIQRFNETITIFPGLDGEVQRHVVPTQVADFQQPGDFFRRLKKDQQIRLAEAIGMSLAGAPKNIRQRQLDLIRKADKTWAKLVAVQVKKTLSSNSSPPETMEGIPLVV